MYPRFVDDYAYSMIRRIRVLLPIGILGCLLGVLLGFVAQNVTEIQTGDAVASWIIGSFVGLFSGSVYVIYYWRWILHSDKAITQLVLMVAVAIFCNEIMIATAMESGNPILFWIEGLVFVATGHMVWVVVHQPISQSDEEEDASLGVETKSPHQS